MIPKLLCLAASLGALSVPQPALASITDTGNEFYTECRRAFDEPGKPMEFGICLGFLQGVLYREQFLTGSKICTPKNATNGQLMDVVLAYLRDNPKNRNLPPMLLILIAFAEAYPCPVAKPSP